MRILIIDNQDSFTFNLSQLIAGVAGHEPLVIPNTEDRWRELIDRHLIAAAVISPGPGSPDRRADFGICLDVIREFNAPLLGVCLGHQGLGLAYGASVERAPAALHGRLSTVTHDGSALFAGVPRSFRAVRYHSLCLRRDSVPICLRITAWAQDGVPMAVSHVSRPQFGVQFHPESVSAEFGARIVRNFLRSAAASPSRPGAGRPAAARRPLRRSAAPVPVIWKTLGRWVDPQEVFERLYADSEYCFWLDSAMVVPGLARFSAMGDAAGPGGGVLRYWTRGRRLQTLRHGVRHSERISGLLPHLRDVLARPVDRDSSLPFDFQTGLVGYLGYELRNELGSAAPRTSALPEAALIDADRCVVFDHAERKIYLVARVEGPVRRVYRWFDCLETALASPPAANLDRCPITGGLSAMLADGPGRYCRKVRQCQEELLAGESYQVCLSSEFTTDVPIAPYQVYRTLRSLNPAPYAAFLRFGSVALLSSSPEQFLRVSGDRLISAKPIKGTSPRDPDMRGDAQLAAWLQGDDKSRSENLIVADLLRNDIGRVAAPGSVAVPTLMEVESYATVHQLVSTVTGELRRDRDCLDCLAAAFPGGSMTGAPKLRTMSIIDRLEERPRGPYAGAIGFLAPGDRMDFSIVIRTIVMMGSRASIAAGGGVVALSDPRSEFEEMLLKARAPLQALASAACGNASAWDIQYATP